MSYQSPIIAATIRRLEKENSRLKTELDLSKKDRKRMSLETKAWKDSAQYFEFVSRNKKEGDSYNYDQCHLLASLITTIKSEMSK